MKLRDENIASLSGKLKEQLTLLHYSESEKGRLEKYIREQKREFENQIATIQSVCTQASCLLQDL